jgi:SpoVK/Ycf46/Vps4 family AAA+-type ATPase
MATADQVKALVRSHAAGDESSFYSVALQVAARAAQGGQTKFASELRTLIDAAKAANGQPGRGPRPVPVTQPRGELAGLLSVTYPESRMDDLIVDSGVRDRLERVLTEQRQSDRLRQHGYEPLRRLLLVGPPGTGKTMTAHVLAGELHLPLFLIRLEALITKFMGETASKLRMVFDAVESTRGVYLFDEVDALAGDRAGSNDVGEIRRVLNSFLQFLDSDTSSSLVVAATNHPQLLDRAVFRRFDSVVEYPLPTNDVALEVVRHRLSTLKTAEVDWDQVEVVAVGLSHAELTLACELAAKETILAGGETVTTEMLTTAMKERRRTLGE